MKTSYIPLFFAFIASLQAELIEPTKGEAPNGTIFIFFGECVMPRQPTVIGLGMVTGKYINGDLLRSAARAICN